MCISDRLEAVAGRSSSDRGSGGMAAKLAAAKIASWSGVTAVIADAGREGVLASAVAGEPGVGTVVRPRDARMSARKLWIAFAVAPSGTIEIDAGARAAVVQDQRSLLAAGVTGVRGTFEIDDAVEIVGPDGAVCSKGMVRVGSTVLEGLCGRRSDDLPDGVARYVIHRDDLVVLP